MNKRFTKLISLLLAVVMVVGMLPVSTFATEGVTPEDTDVEVPFTSEPAETDPIDPSTEPEPEPEAPAGTEAVLGERFTCTIAEEGAYYDVLFTPEVTGWYVFGSYNDQDTRAYILGENGVEIAGDDDGGYANNFNVRAYLYAGTQYTLRSKYWSADRTGTYEAEIYAAEQINLDDQVEVTLSRDHAVAVFSFTPDEDGIYSFYAENIDGNIDEVRVREAGTYRENTSNAQIQSLDCKQCQMEMEAGKSYAVYISVESPQEITTTVCAAEANSDAGLVANVDYVESYVYGNAEIHVYPENPRVPVLSDVVFESGDSEIVEITRQWSANCECYMVGVGSTQITCTIGALTKTIPVTVATLPALTLGQEVQAQAVPDNYEPIYTFTAPEDGVYAFYAYHNYQEPYGFDYAVMVNGGNWMLGGYIGGWDDIYEVQLDLEAGDVCNIRLAPWPDITLNVNLGVVECPDVTEVVFNSDSVTGYAGGLNDYRYVSYTVYPMHANLKGLTWSSADEEVVRIADYSSSDVSMNLLKVGSTVITMNLNGKEFSIPVQVLDYPVLELDNEVEVTSQSYQDKQTYLFTAPEDGVYSFYATCEPNPGSMQIAVDDSTGQVHYGNYYAAWGTKDVQLEMAEGETCKVHLYSGSGNSACTSMVGAVKAPAPTSFSASVGQVEVYLQEENNWSTINFHVQPAHADLTDIEWVSGDENIVLVEGNEIYCDYKAQGVGETVITVTAGDQSLEITVVVKAPQELELDTPVRVEDILSDAPQVFTFTPTESDMYTFYSVSDDNDHRVELTVESEHSWHSSTWYEDWGTEDVMVYMEAGVTYNLYAHCYYGGRAISGTVYLIRSPEATSLTLDVQSISDYADNSWRGITAKAQPAHAYMSDVVWTSDNTEIVRVDGHGQSCNYLLVNPGNANIIVTAGDATFTIPVECKAMPVLEAGVSQYITCVGDDGDVYLTFTPTESGVYTFYQDNMWQMNMSVSLYAHNWTYGQTYAPWGCDYVQGTLNAGEEYRVVVYSTMGGNEAVSCNVGVVKAPAVTAISPAQSAISGYASAAWMELSLSVLPMYAQLGILTASSGNTDVVQVEANATSISYQLVAPGSTEITVTMGDAVLTIPVEVSAMPEAVLDEPYGCDITIAGERVYRNFTPQQSGFYKFYAIDDGNYIDVYGEIYDKYNSQIAGDDDSGGNGRFMMVAYLEAGETYSLVSRCYGTGQGSFQCVITQMEIETLTFGEQQVTVPSNETAYYSFTAETDGNYVFYVMSGDEYELSASGSGGMYYGRGYTEAWGSRDVFVYMNAGETYTFKIRNYNYEDMETTVGFAVAQEATSLSFDPVEITGYPTGSDYKYLKSVPMPAHSLTPDIIWETTDSDVVTLESHGYECAYWLNSVGTASITATLRNGTVYTIPVTVNELPVMELGVLQQVSLEASGDSAKYKFIPTETAVYSFFAEDVDDGCVLLRILDADMNYITATEAYYYDSDEREAQFELEAGVTYYLEAYNQWDWAALINCKLGIIKAPELTGITIEPDGIYYYYSGGESWEDLAVKTQPAHADVSGLTWSVTDDSFLGIYHQDGDTCGVNIFGAGTAQVVVTAENGVQDTMDVEVRQSTQVELGQTYDCLSDEHFEYAQFEFTPETTGLYHAYTVGEGHSEITLYLKSYDAGNIYYQYITSSSWGAEGDNACLQYWLEAGNTYRYVTRVEMYSASKEYGFRVTTPEPVTELSFYDDTWTGFAGDYQFVNYKAKPFTADLSSIELVSSDETVVKVQEDGSVIMVGAGTATLTATAASGVSATCAVTVKAPIALTLNSQKDVVIDPELYCEQFYFTPAAAGTYVVEAKGPMGNKFLYASSENGIDVGSDSRGDVKIQFTAEAGERVDIILEAYYDYPADFTVKVSHSNPATGISFAQGNAISGMVHSISKLNVTFAPVGAAEEEIYWESSDESVATVEYGYVTLVGAGTAVITAETETGLTASCTVTVTEPVTITVSETKKVEVETPGDTGVFKFVPESTANYVVRSIGNAETSLEILDENGEYVGAVNYALRAAYGIIGESGNVVELEAGKTYFVRASMASAAVGAFKVVIEEHLSVVDFEITQLPDQAECYRNSSIELSGLELKVEWSDGSFTDYSYDNGGDLKDEDFGWSTSEQSTGVRVSINVGSTSQSFLIRYAEKTVTGISIIDNEEFCVVEYADGEWYEGEFHYYLSTELLGAEITYSDGSTKTVDSINGPVDGAWIESYFDGETWEIGADDNTVTFEYMGAETQYNVRMVASPVESVTVTSAPSKVYTFGDGWYGWTNEDGIYEMYGTDYDLTGLSLTVKYTNGTSDTFTHEDIEGGMYSSAQYLGDYPIGFTDVDATVGKNTVTISYMGVEAEYEILVVEPTVKYVQVVKAPDMIPAEHGFTTDSLGMQLKLTYTDGSSKIITATEDNVSYLSGWRPVTAITDGDIEIRVDYESGYGTVYAYVVCGTVSSYQLIAETITSYNIEDIEITGVSETDSSVDMKMTYMDGTIDVMTLKPMEGTNPIKGGGDYSFRGIASTDKGLLSYNVWMYRDDEGNVVEYEVEVLDQYLYLEVPGVSDVVVGDADGNGVVDGMDATLLLQYAAGWDVTINEAAGDADGNGVVDGMDATLLLQYAAGWDVTLGGN